MNKSWKYTSDMMVQDETRKTRIKETGGREDYKRERERWKEKKREKRQSGLKFAFLGCTLSHSSWPPLPSVLSIATAG